MKTAKRFFAFLPVPFWGIASLGEFVNPQEPRLLIGVLTGLLAILLWIDWRQTR